MESGRYGRKEQVLKHLSNYRGIESNVTCPYAVTQDGIADNIGISRANASIVLKKLESSGMVCHEKRHVNGGKVVRNCYALMPQGWLEVQRIDTMREVA